MRDLKPENIVLDGKNNAKICDFGWAADLKDVTVPIKAGTYAYMSPESLSGTLQGEKSDVWSLGIFLFELCFNKEPFQGRSCNEMLKAIKTTEIDFSGRAVQSAKELIASVLKFSTKDRPNLKHILQSQFFQESFLAVDPSAFKRDSVGTVPKNTFVVPAPQACPGIDEPKKPNSLAGAEHVCAA